SKPTVLLTPSAPPDESTAQAPVPPPRTKKSQQSKKRNVQIDLGDGQATLLYSGKVREIVDIGYNVLAMVGSDRLSAFDRHITEIPGKGAMLNGMSAYWFNATRSICPNHFISSSQNVMFVKRCIPFKVEVVVRGYITGSTNTSLWTHYNNGVR